MFSPSWLDAESPLVKIKDKIKKCRRCKYDIGASLGLRKLHDSLEKQ